MAANSLKEGLFEGVSGNLWNSATKDQDDDIYQSLQVIRLTKFSLLLL